jgi:hypothetical protein
MRAIAGNDLAELEDSVANQQALSLELSDLAAALRDSSSADQAACEAIEPALSCEIRTAAGELQQLNLRYSILLQHSSRSVSMMAALFSSFKGQLQEASGARVQHSSRSRRMVTSWEA